MIHLGRSEGYIERRLGDLAGLVQRSRLAYRVGLMETLRLAPGR